MSLSIDIETFSSVDLIKSGVYAYAQSDDFEILLLAYSVNGGEVKVLDSPEVIRGDQVFWEMLDDPTILKHAWNANFERTCFGAYLGRTLSPSGWRCTMVQALELGLPGSLELSASVLDVDQQKMKEGRALINYFSKPCRPTISNGKRTRNLPEHDLIKWEVFKNYCAQDVRTEQAIQTKLNKWPITAKEQQLYELDQKINDRGILLDPVLIDQAIRLDESLTARLTKEAKDLTGLSNPNSVAQLKAWILETEGLDVESLDKRAVPGIIQVSQKPETKRMLEIRQAMSKTSVSKYQAMERCEGKDGRARGLLQFYGASTGRWAGRLIQVQNLPQNKIEELDAVRALLRSGDFDSLELIYENPASVLSQLIRTAFVPEPGHVFAVADFSAIEARVIAWLANERWRLKAFEKGEDIYCASASQMFGVPVERHGVNGELRQRGKIAELALGYGGSVGALKQMGALEMGLEEDDLPELVSQWRGANQQIVRLWSDLNQSAIDAVESNSALICARGQIKVYQSNGFLVIRLPSGRELFYASARLTTNRFGQPAVAYDSMNQTTRKWQETETYGGKLVENSVQAIARDCLAETMLKLDAQGLDIQMHVHDEVVIQIPETGADKTLETITDTMGEPLDWAPGLNLKADGYLCNYYIKD